jgi:hypothetical protein
MVCSNQHSIRNIRRLELSEVQWIYHSCQDMRNESEFQLYVHLSADVEEIFNLPPHDKNSIVFTDRSTHSISQDGGSYDSSV